MHLFIHSILYVLATLGRIYSDEQVRYFNFNFNFCLAKCVSPYVQASSGNCINVMIDINNCGKLNNVCPSTYTSCSAGLCSNLASIILLNGTFIWAASVSGSVDDLSSTITIPFNITLYNKTTKSVTVTTNGVSLIGI